MDKQTQRPASLISLLLVANQSLLIAFFSQAAALDYTQLLKLILLYGVLPQLVVLAYITIYIKGKATFIGFGITILSWLFVCELAYRAIAG